jgi:hypothetical protein
MFNWLGIVSSWHMPETFSSATAWVGTWGDAPIGHQSFMALREQRRKALVHSKE